MASPGQSKLYKIGELARRSGVSVKTLRFYSDAGLLPPAEVTDAGHRLYSDLDHARLEAIRSLREVGVGLEAIAQTMQPQTGHETSPEKPLDAVLRLQLEAVELDLARVQRRRSVLRAALGRDDALGYLRAARTLAALDARERQAFLSKRVEQMFSGVPAEADWLEAVWGTAMRDLPADLTVQQFDAWLELAELLADEDFIENSNRIGREFWGQFKDEASRTRYANQSGPLEERIQEAVRAGLPHEGEDGQKLVRAWLSLQAQATGRRGGAAHARECLERIECNTDPRAVRFWALVSRLRGSEAQHEAVNAAHAWRVRGLEHLVGRSSGEAPGEPGSAETVEEEALAEWRDGHLADLGDRLFEMEASMTTEKRAAWEASVARAQPARYVPGVGIVVDGE